MGLPGSGNSTLALGLASPLRDRNQGLHAIAALMSSSAQACAAARQVIGTPDFREIHVSTPLTVHQARDLKGLLAKSRPANLAEVHLIYEIPVSPDLRTDASNIVTEDALATIASLTAL